MATIVTLELMEWEEVEIVNSIIQMLMGFENKLFQLSDEESPSDGALLVNKSFLLTTCGRQVQCKSRHGTNQPSLASRERLGRGITGNSNYFHVKPLQKLLESFASLGTTLYRLRQFTHSSTWPNQSKVDNDLRNRKSTVMLLHTLHGNVLELMSAIDADLSLIDMNLHHNQSSPCQPHITILSLHVRTQPWQQMTSHLSQMIHSLSKGLLARNSHPELDIFGLIERRLSENITLANKLNFYDSRLHSGHPSRPASSAAIHAIPRNLTLYRMACDESFHCLYQLLDILSEELLQQIIEYFHHRENVSGGSGSDAFIAPPSGIQSAHLRDISMKVGNKVEDINFLHRMQQYHIGHSQQRKQGEGRPSLSSSAVPSQGKDHRKFNIGRGMNELLNLMNLNASLEVYPRQTNVRHRHQLSGLSQHAIAVTAGQSTAAKGSKSSNSGHISWLSNRRQLQQSSSSPGTVIRPMTVNRQTQLITKPAPPLTAAMAAVTVTAVTTHITSRQLYEALYVPMKLTRQLQFIRAIDSSLAAQSAETLAYLAGKYHISSHLSYIRQLYFMANQEIWRPLLVWLEGFISSPAFVSQMAAGRQGRPSSPDKGQREGQDQQGNSSSGMKAALEQSRYEWNQYLDRGEGGRAAAVAVTAVSFNQLFIFTLDSRSSRPKEAPPSLSSSSSPPSYSSMIQTVLRSVHLTLQYKSPLADLYSPSQYSHIFDYLLSLHGLYWLTNATWRLATSTSSSSSSSSTRHGSSRTATATAANIFHLCSCSCCSGAINRPRQPNLSSSSGHGSVIGCVCGLQRAVSNGLLSTEQAAHLLVLVNRFRLRLPAILSFSRSLYQLCYSSLMNIFEVATASVPIPLPATASEQLSPSLSQSTQEEQFQSPYGCLQLIKLFHQSVLEDVMSVIRLSELETATVIQSICHTLEQFHAVCGLWAQLQQQQLQDTTGHIAWANLYHHICALSESSEAIRPQIDSLLARLTAITKESPGGYQTSSSKRQQQLSPAFSNLIKEAYQHFIWTHSQSASQSSQ